MLDMQDEPDPESEPEPTATIEDVQAGVDQYLETSRRELDRRELKILSDLVAVCLNNDHATFTDGPLYDETVRVLAVTRRRIAAITGGVNPSWSVEHGPSAPGM